MFDQLHVALKGQVLVDARKMEFETLDMATTVWYGAVKSVLKLTGSDRLPVTLQTKEVVCKHSFSTTKQNALFYGEGELDWVLTEANEVVAMEHPCRFVKGDPNHGRRGWGTRTNRETKRRPKTPLATNLSEGPRH